MSAPNRDDLRRRLLRNPAAGYTPTGSAFGAALSYALDGKPYFTFFDVPRMMRDPRVRFTLRLWRSPFQQVKWKVKAESDAVTRFVDSTFRRFWRRSVPRMLHRYCQFGFAPAAAEWCVRRGKVRLDRVQVVEPRDATPLVFDRGRHAGRMAGFRLTARGGARCVTAPHAIWYAGQQEYGAFHDAPLLAGMYDPWAEKNTRGGALDTRRLGHWKYAFSGDVIRHPKGTQNFGTDEQPQVRDNQDVAREALESIYSGSGLTLSNEPNQGMPGEYAWKVERGGSNVNLPALLEYPKQLDAEITTGGGIPPEVLEAAEVGSGWSGRMISLLTFFGSIDEFVGPMVDAFEPACRYATTANFGPRAYWELEPVPLTDALKEAAGSGPGGGEGPNPLPGLLGMPPKGSGPGGTALRKPVAMSDDRAAGVSAAARRLMSKRKRDLVGLVVAAMVQEQLKASSAGDPDSAADTVAGLAELAGDPDRVREILSAAVEMSWAPYEGPKGGRGWINDQGRVVYGGTKPGEKRERQKAVAAQARAILSKALHHEASPEELAQLSDHLPALTVGQLRTARVLLNAKFGGGRRRQEMVDKLVEHVRGRAEEEKRKAAEPPEPEPDPAPPRRGPRSGELADGTTVTFIPDRLARVNRARYATVMVDPKKLDAAWSKDAGYYVPPGGGGAEIPGRIARFKEFLAKGKPVEAPKVYLHPDGHVSFEDGRHRFRTLADAGIDRVAVTVDRGQVEAVKRALNPQPGEAPPAPPPPPEAKTPEAAAPGPPPAPPGYTPAYRNTNTKGDVFEPADPSEVKPELLIGFHPVGPDGKDGDKTQRPPRAEGEVVRYLLGKGNSQYRVYFPTRKNGVPVHTFASVDGGDFAGAKKLLKAAGGTIDDLPKIYAYTAGTGKPLADRLAAYVAGGGALTPPPPKAGPAAAPGGSKKVPGGQLDSEWADDPADPNGGRVRFHPRRLKGGGEVLGVGAEHPDGVVTAVGVGRNGKVSYTVRPRTDKEESARQERARAGEQAARDWAAASTAGATDTEVWPRESLGAAPEWTPIDPPPGGRFGYGTRRYVGRLSDGRVVGRTVHTGMDDYREVFRVPGADPATPVAADAGGAGGGGPEPGPRAADVTPPAPTPAAPPAAGDGFAEAVKAAGRGLKDWAGNTSETNAGINHKVHVSDLYDAVRERFPGMGEDEFKRRLLHENRAGTLGLARIDLQHLADPGKLERSRIPHLNSDFHTVDVNHTPAPPPPPPAAAPVPASAEEIDRREAPLRAAIGRARTERLPDREVETLVRDATAGLSGREVVEMARRVAGVKVSSRAMALAELRAALTMTARYEDNRRV